MAVAEAGDVVFIAAEVLLFRSPGDVRLELGLGEVQTYLSLKEQNCWFISCQTISSDDIVQDRSNSQ